MWGRILDRIREQVDDDLLQPSGIPHYPQLVGAMVEDDVLVVCGKLRRPNSIGHQRDEVNRPRRSRSLPCSPG